MRSFKLAATLLAISSSATLHAADNARFDLAGPKITVRVTRGNSTLPIAQVPNLLAGDRLWIKADLPQTQSNHLVLVVAFLRGTTNEPPDNWFTEIDTWEKKKTQEGTTITVPAEAQQALVFIAPETGGDFKTLRGAVKGRPGLFIRADADLNEASFEQQRIERYLAAMKTVPQGDQKAIADHSAKLAATLALKPNADCFRQSVENQVTCLTQTSAPVLLNDGHSVTVAEAVSTGPSSDFINTASYTQTAGAGLYSAYVGAVVDLVHIVAMLKTAQYQYIPGLAFPQGETINLRLNTPPSFINPKTVIVVGLPAIQKASLPPLKPHNADQVSCLLQPKMSMQIEGAPLVFSTGFAHDMILHLNRTGPVTDLPLTADAFEGGLVITKDEPRKALSVDDAKPAPSAKPDGKPGSTSDLVITGTVRGYWGFDSFEGPTLKLQQLPGKDWKVIGDTQLFAGQDNHLTLTGEGTGCVQHIALSDNKSKDVNVSFKPADPKQDKDARSAKDTLALDVPLKTVEPGGYSLGIKQYGDDKQDRVPLTAYSAGIKMNALKLHAGDNVAELTGYGLKNVVSVQIADETFTPQGEPGDNDVHLQAKSGVSPADGAKATVKLKDGRTMDVKVSTQAARPSLKLLSLQSTPPQQKGAIAVTLGAKDDIPLNGQLTFVVQTKDVFPRNQTVEVATADGGVHTTLSLADNNLILQDEHTAVARLDPLKAFGQSAFGILAMRPVTADGTPGDWTRLGKLVRTPQISEIQCTSADAQTCRLTGNNLFMVQAFAATPDFAKAAEVPTGFADSSFNVPTPADGTTLYLKLRDDTSALAKVTLPTPVPKAAPVTAPAPVAKATVPSSAGTIELAAPAGSKPQ